MGLFDDIMEPDYPVNNAEKDDTKITQVILYFSDSDALLLKRMAKEVMKSEMPNDFIEKANLSDLFLLMLKKHPACQNFLKP